MSVWCGVCLCFMCFRHSLCHHMYGQSRCLDNFWESFVLVFAWLRCLELIARCYISYLNILSYQMCGIFNCMVNSSRNCDYSEMD